MKRKIVCILILFIFSVAATTTWAQSFHPLTLQDILKLAEKHSPQISAAQLQEIAAKHTILISESYYYPTVDVDAIDSKGFPGSTSALGIGGIMGSPYRSGLGKGVVATQTLWDFGRTQYAVKVSHYAAERSVVDIKITRDQVRQIALDTYYSCALDRTQRDTFARISHESAIIAKEVNQFVNTGQRSVIDRYLTDAQTQEAVTAQAVYHARYLQATRELAILTGVSSKYIFCPSLLHRHQLPISATTSIYGNPFLARDIAELNVARAQVGAAEAEFFPKIVALASYGNLEDARLVTKHDYALGLGIILPLFDGFKISNEYQRAKVVLAAKHAAVAAEKQNIDETNAKFDEDIHASAVQIQHLNQELALANEGFKVAKDRYFTLQGTLVDLREALRNLARTETAMNNARAQWLQATGDKALINGQIA